MSEYERGLSIAELREQFLEDSEKLDAEELFIRYGREGPRLLNSGDLMRPSSRHLRSPMYIDEQEREYTPDETNATVVWWIRLPAHVTARHRAEIRDGKRSPLDILQFPEPGEQLKLTHLRDRQRAVETVRLESISERKIASAQVSFDRAVPVVWSKAAEQQLKRNVQFAERRRKRQATETPH